MVTISMNKQNYSSLEFTKYIKDNCRSLVISISVFDDSEMLATKGEPS